MTITPKSSSRLGSIRAQPRKACITIMDHETALAGLRLDLPADERPGPRSAGHTARISATARRLADTRKHAPEFNDSQLERLRRVLASALTILDTEAAVRANALPVADGQVTA